MRLLVITILAQRSLKYGLKAILEWQKKTNLKTEQSFYYFGYGANLSNKHLEKYNISSQRIGTALLDDHQLKFDLPCEYIGKGFAGIQPSPGAQTWGSLFKINREGLAMLDVLEWVPFKFYERKTVTVTCEDKTYANVQAYFTCSPKEGLVPSEGYLNYIISNGISEGLPQVYLDELKKTETKTEFEIDPGFCLSNPGKRRWKEESLRRFYQEHDKLREKLTKLIP